MTNKQKKFSFANSGLAAAGDEADADAACEPDRFGPPVENRLALVEQCLDGRLEKCDFLIGAVIIAGWTGRDPDAVEAHIRELQVLGVSRPGNVPVFYRVSAGLLTTATSVDVLGSSSSGEIEAVLYIMKDGLWIGVGSDHTDREVEARLNVAASKQICPKPVSREIWRYDDVKDHWQDIILRSYITTTKGRRLYQEGEASALLDPVELVEKYAELEGAPSPGTAMFCGTFAVEGGPESCDLFEVEMEDPVKNRTLRHVYSIRVLPIAE